MLGFPVSPGSVVYVLVGCSVSLCGANRTNWSLLRMSLSKTIKTDSRMVELVIVSCFLNKNSSGDEIANVNFYAVRPGSYPNLLK